LLGLDEALKIANNDPVEFKSCDTPASNRGMLWE